MYGRDPQKAISHFSKIKDSDILSEAKVSNISKEKLHFIKIIFNRLNRRVMRSGLRVDWMRIFDDYPEGGCIQSYKKCCDRCFFLFVDKKSFSSRKRCVSVLEHEFAHVFFWANILYQQISLTFFEKMTGKELEYFTDGNFILGDPDAGHPSANVDELFASTFMLASMQAEGLLDKTVRPPKGAVLEYWQWINSLPLFRVNAHPAPAWPKKTNSPNKEKFTTLKFHT